MLRGVEGNRLDVAFAENPELEENSLRGLFHVYLDMLAFEHLTQRSVRYAHERL